ncbi:hypothetical protein SESBI_30021, partial [Sesbania bispinosa]
QSKILVPKYQTPLKMIYPPVDVDAEKKLVDIEIKEAIDMFQQCLSLRINKNGLTWVMLDAQSRNPAGW